MSRPSGDAPSILVVDDEPLTATAIADLLEAEGYRTVHAPHGDAALQLIAETPVDLVLLDVFMPQKEGLETIRELRARYPDLPVIVMSGGPRATTVGSAGTYLSIGRLLGAAATLAKPITRDVLIAAVTAALAGSLPKVKT